VFPVRYELDFYILFRRNSVFKGLTACKVKFMAVETSFVLARDACAVVGEGIGSMELVGWLVS
jgi:hypothetical protein